MISIPGKERQFQHKEAFCLMLYASDRKCMRTVWNSRDGVTPFGFLCPDCGRDLTHIDWHKDTRVINKELHEGDLYWVDCTYEEYLEGQKKLIDKYWDSPDFSHLREQYGTKETLLETCSRNDFRVGQPALRIHGKGVVGA